MKQKQQIAILALVLIVLLLFPGAVKMLHTHHASHCESVHCRDFASIQQPNDLCPVCDFEFVSFIGETETHIETYPLVFSTIRHQKTEQSLAEFTRYFSLRAPPASA